MYTLDKKISQRAVQYDIIAYGIDLDNGIILNEDLGIDPDDEGYEIDSEAYQELESEENIL